MNQVKEYRIPLLLAIIKFILPFILQNGSYELHRDEYLYLAEAHHLDWGFMEVPPLLSVFAKITSLSGDGFFWVKFWPAIFGALTVWTTCSIVRELGGRMYAQFIAGLCIIAGVYLRTNYLFQPNFLEIYWWTLLAYLLIRYVNTHQSKYLYCLGVVAGLSFLSKYSIMFFGAGIVAGLALTRTRKVFFERHIYIAFLLALLIATPNIIWQYMHKWPVAFHMKELRESQLVYVSPLDFLREQFLMHFSCFPVFVIGLYYLFFTSKGSPYRLIGWIFLTVIILLFATSGKSYYSLGAFPMLFAAGAVCLENWLKPSLVWIRYAVPVVIIVLFGFALPLLLPVSKPPALATYYQKAGGMARSSLKWEDQQQHALPQDFADMLGWKELSKKVEILYRSLPDSSKSRTMIFCWNYGQAGAIQYYSKGSMPVYAANASFLFWMPDTYNLSDIILVSTSGSKETAQLTSLFSTVRQIDSISNPYAREYGTKIMLLQGADPQMNKLLEAKIRKQKDEFRR